MYEISLFGGFQLKYEGERVTSFNSARLQALLAYLLLHDRNPQARRQIAYIFWPESTEKQARTNLRKLFLQLRRALPDSEGLLAYDNQNIQWRTSQSHLVDVVEVQQILDLLKNDPQNINALKRLFNLYRGQLLPNCYDDWLLPIRDEIHQQVMTALGSLVSLEEDRRAYADSIRYAQHLLHLDPLQEKIYQQLMHLRAAEGNRASALKVYQECVDVLNRELGVGPAPETDALYERLLNAEHTYPAAKAISRSTPDIPPLIGRQTEWKTLKAAWQQAERGQPTFLTIFGEAGIGKTRLAEELYIWANQQGIAAARTRSYQAQGASAYSPITELLRTETIRGRLDALSELRQSQIARLLPELLDEDPTLSPPQPMAESWQRQQFFDALAHAILKQDEPLLLLFDDLQWCDGETLEWLHYLMRSAEQSMLLIVGTVRTGEIDTEHPLFTLNNNLRRDNCLHEIFLPPLTAEEVASLARSITDADLVTSQTTQLYNDTEGNPLFVVEMVRAGFEAINDSTSLPSTAATMPLASPAQGAQMSKLPPKVYAVIQARLTQLSTNAQKLISIAAVIGRSFSLNVLMAVSKQDEDNVIDCLDELWTRQIIREQGTDAFDFSHDRIRDVAYSELSRTRQRLLHRRVAETLESLYTTEIESISALLAEQYMQGGEQEQACHFFKVAGAYALDQFAHHDARRYFEQALHLTADQSFAPRCQRYLDCMETYHTLGDSNAYRDIIEQMDSTLTRWGQEVAGKCNEREYLQAALAVHQTTYASRFGNHQKAIELGKKAAALAKKNGTLKLEASALLWLGHGAFMTADFELARTSMEEGARQAKAANEDYLHVKNLETLMQVYMFSGGGSQLIRDTLDECMQIHTRTQNLSGQVDIYNKYGYLPVAQGEGDFIQAEKDYELALTMSQQIGYWMGESIITRNMSVLMTCLGDYGRAVKMAKKAIDMDREAGSAGFEAIALNYLGFAYFNQGRLAEAREIQEEALSKLQKNNIGQWEIKALTALGWIHYYLGQYDTALIYLHDGLQKSRKLNEARQEGSTLTCMGHIFTTLHQFADAADVYEKAVAAHRSMDQTMRAQEALAGLAHLKLRQGKHHAALLQIEPILTYLQSNPPFLTAEGFHIYLFCHRILIANQDENARKIGRTAFDQLQKRAATIDNPEHKHLFWAKMLGHNEIHKSLQ